MTSSIVFPLIISQSDHTIAEQEKAVASELSHVLHGGKLQAIVCTAGGFAMGSMKDDTFLTSFTSMYSPEPLRL